MTAQGSMRKCFIDHGAPSAMRLIVLDRKEVVIVGEMASTVEFGLFQDRTVAVNCLQHLGLTERQLVRSDPDNWSIPLMCNFDCVSSSEFSHVVEGPAARQPAHQRPRISRQRM